MVKIEYHIHEVNAKQNALFIL